MAPKFLQDLSLGSSKQALLLKADEITEAQLSFIEPI